MNYSNKEKNRFINRYGKWALVTGASSGIGESISKHLAALGFNLLLVARNNDKLKLLAYHFAVDFKVQAIPFQADLTKEADLEALKYKIEKIEQDNSAITGTSDEFGLAVLNAGFGTSGEFRNASLNDEREMLALNCNATLTLAHYFSHRFSMKRRGGIILLGSLVGFQGVPFAAHYAATKAYIQSLGEALALELKPFHVDVLVAAPGPVKTGFGPRAKMTMTNALEAESVATSILKSLGKASTVHPGWLSKVLMLGLSSVPRWGKIRIMKAVMGEMTKETRTSTHK
ncbi:MAG: SDR family NAD(P)-dependent oxidoreductase [Chloroherpetonaceae bacterium]|nr:SDR family NAD(P)-dependent oxidoreductase [Chloroherpetonaceae bacterium]